MYACFSPCGVRTAIAGCSGCLPMALSLCFGRVPPLQPSRPSYGSDFGRSVAAAAEEVLCHPYNLSPFDFLRIFLNPECRRVAAAAEEVPRGHRVPRAGAGAVAPVRGALGRHGGVRGHRGLLHGARGPREGRNVLRQVHHAHGERGLRRGEAHQAKVQRGLRRGGTSGKKGEHIRQERGAHQAHAMRREC